DRQRMTVLAGGRHAVTYAEVVARFAHVDLLRLRLGTGRTHQIRVHLAHVGHPVVGDREYAFGGSRRVTPSLRLPAEQIEARVPRTTRTCLPNATPCSILASSHRMSDGGTVRLLVFRVGTLACAAEAATVREILPRFEPTRIPGAPALVAGLVNVRGSLVTVV